MTLSDSLKSQIKTHALSDTNQEICGLLILNKSNELEVVHCQNIHENKEHFFCLKPEDYLRGKTLGTIVAIYHSHSERQDFSDFDKLNCENCKIPFILYCIKNDTFSYYQPRGYFIPFVNREYVVGFLDCLTLILDYYKQELNITIPNLDHPYRFVDNKADHPENTQSYSILIDHFLNNGFINTNNLVKNNVILFNSFKVPSPVHCAIYLSGEQILHHPFKRKSTIEHYGISWKKRSTNILIHKSQI